MGISSTSWRVRSWWSTVVQIDLEIAGSSKAIFNMWLVLNGKLLTWDALQKRKWHGSGVLSLPGFVWGGNSFIYPLQIFKDGVGRYFINARYQRIVEWEHNRDLSAKMVFKSKSGSSLVPLARLERGPFWKFQSTAGGGGIQSYEYI